MDIRKKAIDQLIDILGNPYIIKDTLDDVYVGVTGFAIALLVLKEKPTKIVGGNAEFLDLIQTDIIPLANISHVTATKNSGYIRLNLYLKVGVEKNFDVKADADINHILETLVTCMENKK